MITPTKLLIEATRKSRRVVLVTRPPDKTSTRNYHKELADSGVTVLYNRNLHAKLLLFDDEIAIVSSMNLLVGATAGFSWEAGLITLDKETVDRIKHSITKLQLDSAKF
jgi:phosphatidylserine/phosphatidylglycerophosphate/cardiolipin synthase-like enzyme